jgi:succinylglutamate desuccinylase
MSNVERFLSYAGLLDAPIPEIAAPETFRFRNEIRPKHADFRFVRAFRNFDRIAPGEAYASEAGKLLVNDSGHELRVVFAPPKFTLGDGAGFLLDPA